MKLNSFKNLSLLAVAVMALNPVVARSVLIDINSGNEPGGVVNVLFNAAGPNNIGTTIQGGFANDPFFVNFTSPTIIEGDGGQATLAPVTSGDLFTDLCFSLANGATFTRAVLNIDAEASGSVLFTVSYLNALGSPFMETFSLGQNGSNFFSITAAEGARITEVCFDSTVDVASVSQIRLGGFAPAGQVPDGGGTVALLGMTLVGIEGLRRKLGIAIG